MARAHGGRAGGSGSEGHPDDGPIRRRPKRPLNSRLSNEKFQQAFGVTLPDWRQGCGSRGNRSPG
ncbi:hypothetical protein [Klebsiella pneumoniae]|uniref:hypothetical protein n=1 Tax=Klebsiella pneumoniae TaxID=573 RepID=UPI00222EE6EC|nr:hypothetical protein [Klebsiella pneumoniae]